MKRKQITYIILLVLLSCVHACAQQPNGSAESKEQNKYRQDYVNALDTYSAVIGNIQQYFVDTIDIKQMNKRGIDAMLRGLDPFTEFIPAENTDDLKLMTTGEYAGVGAIISQRADSAVIIRNPMRGLPADEAGLKAGDRILRIDGKDFRKSNSPDVSQALKGVSGTLVKVEVERYGENKPLVFDVKRRKVQMPSVPYSGLIGKGVGYIGLNSFTDKSAAEIKTALQALKKEGASSLILDLRGNGGGVMQAAIEIVNLFVPRGKLVLETKGRNKETSASYHTSAEPVDLTMPVLVLIDEQSASSSEIVAGALQDMDRAVVMGRKSYGKGLVQATRGLPNGGILKLTTAKYYIPSGRCIQRLDYSHSNETGRAESVADSLRKTFFTAGGRPVLDAGGILPDIELKADTTPTLLYYLVANDKVFDYVTQYYYKHKSIATPESFAIDDADYAEFSELLLKSDFDYDRQSGKVLDRLEELAKLEGYLPEAKKEIEALKEKLKPNLKRDLQRLQKEIRKFLSSEIVTRYYYDEGTIRYALKSDKDVAAALELLQSNDGIYAKTLQAVPKLTSK